ncbi:MAG: hypothetical protein JYX80_09565 [Candidatus Scalindua sediminis]|nr:hypothetical protein [Candidatus Scalindua sediminis]
MIKIVEGYENSEKICKIVEDVVVELGIKQKLEHIVIKHPPSGFPIDMNYLISDNKSLDLEIVDSMVNLEGRVRHELMHVADQLDEKFKFKESNIPTEGTGDYRRYKYLWNVYIDSRLERSGKPAYDTQEDREEEMKECYPELSMELRKECFDFLWGREPLNHEQITEISRNLFSASKEIESLAHSRGEKQIKFETLEELINYGRE